jgi:hypothetical protein
VVQAPPTGLAPSTSPVALSSVPSATDLDGPAKTLAARSEETILELALAADLPGAAASQPSLSAVTASSVWESSLVLQPALLPAPAFSSSALAAPRTAGGDFATRAQKATPPATDDDLAIALESPDRLRERL